MLANRKDGSCESQALPMGVVIICAISVSKQKGWKAWVTGATDGSCDQRRYQC